MSRNSEISLYVDTMIVETLLTDSHLVKTAQAGNAISSLVSKVKGYFMNNIDQNDKAGSVLNLLAPGALSMTLSAIGLPWLGILLGLCMRVFHIDVNAILGDIWSKIKEMVTSKKPISSESVDAVVDQAVEAENKPATEDQAQAGARFLKPATLKDAQLLKIAMIEYERQLFSKEARPSSHSDLLSLFSTKKTNTASLLGRVLKWIFKIALASAGLMVAGDVINKFLGRPNAIDGTVQNGRPVAQQQAPAVAPRVVPKQTKFPLNPSYHEEQRNGPNDTWEETVPNTAAGIGGMILAWAHQVYQGLDGQDSNIQNTAGFQTAVETIVNKNQASAGGPIVIIPRMFTSKKQIVDYFIDDVAGKAN